MADAFGPQLLDPLKMAGPAAAVIFPAADHLLDLSGGQIGLQADRADEGGAHDPLVLGGGVQQDGEPLVCPALVFTGDVQHDVFPPAAPVPGQACGHPLGPLGQQEKLHVGPLADDVPDILPPGVGLFQEKVGGHAYPDQLTALDLVAALPVPLEGVIKACLGPVDPGTVLVPQLVQKIHIAVLAAFAALDAAVPGVPDIVHLRHPPFGFFQYTRGM